MVLGVGCSWIWTVVACCISPLCVRCARALQKEKTRVGSGKKVFFEGTSMVAVPFMRGRETLTDTINGPVYKRAPFKVEKSLQTPPT